MKARIRLMLNFPGMKLLLVIEAISNIFIVYAFCILLKVLESCNYKALESCTGCVTVTEPRAIKLTYKNTCH